MAVAELAGEFRVPRNAFQQAQGSIHNDTVASKLGFKGGTVPGSVHMDQFVPMLLELYGERWFERGDMSLHFTQATVDAEKVRAIVHPGEGRARLSMFNEAGAKICEGTASPQAPDSLSELARRLPMQTPAEPGRLRILTDYAVGDEVFDIPLRVEVADLQDSLQRITEPHRLYTDEHVLPPSYLVRLAHGARSKVLAKVEKERRAGHKDPAQAILAALEEASPSAGKRRRSCSRSCVSEANRVMAAPSPTEPVEKSTPSPSLVREG